MIRGQRQDGRIAVVPNVGLPTSGRPKFPNNMRSVGRHIFGVGSMGRQNLGYAGGAPHQTGPAALGARTTKREAIIGNVRGLAVSLLRRKGAYPFSLGPTERGKSSLSRSVCRVPAHPRLPLADARESVTMKPRVRLYESFTGTT